MNNTMILAIGNAGANIVKYACTESANQKLKEARVVFADTDKAD